MQPTSIPCKLQWLSFLISRRNCPEVRGALATEATMERERPSGSAEIALLLLQTAP